MQRQQQQQQQTPRGRLVRSQGIIATTPQSLKPYVLGDFGVEGTQQVLQQFSQQKKAQQNVRPICPITNETIPKGRLYVADCLHAFDIRAITEWVVLQKHLTCPLCRRRTVGFTIGGRNRVGNRHINRWSSTTTKGGWVAHTATVSPDAFIGFHCKVADTAKVLGNAALQGQAIALGNSRVEKHATVEDRAMVLGDACVTDHAVITGLSIIQGYVGGDAVVNNKAVSRNERIVE
jgi:hypothetical protein